jgi:energy-coupling factor transporter transmembrane protein EcfT
MDDFILNLIFTYLSPLIEGDFKWTLLGASLTVLAFFTSRIFKLFSIPKFILLLITLILICLFVWYGHEFVDPYFHEMVRLWNAPLNGEHMNLDMP